MIELAKLNGKTIHLMMIDKKVSLFVLLPLCVRKLSVVSWQEAFEITVERSVDFEQLGPSPADRKEGTFKTSSCSSNCSCDSRLSEAFNLESGLNCPAEKYLLQQNQKKYFYVLIAFHNLSKRNKIIYKNFLLPSC